VCARFLVGFWVGFLKMTASTDSIDLRRFFCADFSVADGLGWKMKIKMKSERIRRGGLVFGEIAFPRPPVLRRSEEK